jgi:protoheme IX farnesyltransferase
VSTTVPISPAADHAQDATAQRAGGRKPKPTPTARGFPALVETTKIGITRLVTMTAAVGFVMVAWQRIATLRAGDGVALATWAEVWAALGGWRFALTALACLVGTALSAGGANTLNQWMEVHRDAKMQRTATRPIPSGRTTGDRVLGFGVLLSVVGLVVLWLGCGLVPMLVSLACLVSYIVLYTPLKPVSPLATFIGAIPGALPPMIGTAAASSALDWTALREPMGLALFALMFVWQIPHFIALAWLYRDDYERGGFAVLPVMDKQGTMTAWTVFLWAVVLIPATILPGVWSGGTLGWPYIAMAGVTGVAFLWMALRFARERTRERARGVFLASVLHLPVLLAGMVVEGGVRAVA